MRHLLLLALVAAPAAAFILREPGEEMMDPAYAERYFNKGDPSVPTAASPSVKMSKDLERKLSRKRLSKKTMENLADHVMQTVEDTAILVSDTFSDAFDRATGSFFGFTRLRSPFRMMSSIYGEPTWSPYVTDTALNQTSTGRDSYTKPAKEWNGLLTTQNGDIWAIGTFLALRLILLGVIMYVFYMYIKIVWKSVSSTPVVAGPKRDDFMKSLRSRGMRLLRTLEKWFNLRVDPTAFPITNFHAVRRALETGNGAAGIGPFGGGKWGLVRAVHDENHVIRTAHLRACLGDSAFSLVDLSPKEATSTWWSRAKASAEAWWARRFANEDELWLASGEEEVAKPAAPDLSVKRARMIRDTLVKAMRSVRNKLDGGAGIALCPQFLTRNESAEGDDEVITLHRLLREVASTELTGEAALPAEKKDEDKAEEAALLQAVLETLESDKTMHVTKEILGFDMDSTTVDVTVAQNSRGDRMRRIGYTKQQIINCLKIVQEDEELPGLKAADTAVWCGKNHLAEMHAVPEGALEPLFLLGTTKTRGPQLTLVPQQKASRNAIGIPSVLSVEEADDTSRLPPSLSRIATERPRIVMGFGSDLAGLRTIFRLCGFEKALALRSPNSRRLVGLACIERDYRRVFFIYLRKVEWHLPVEWIVSQDPPATDSLFPLQDVARAQVLSISV